TGTSSSSATTSEDFISSAVYTAMGISSVSNTPANSNPPVTLSGNPASSTYNNIWINIQITTSGLLGTAKFAWTYSTNSGQTWTTGGTNVTTGSSVTLGSTSITASFASGYYITNAGYLSPSYGWSIMPNTNITDGSM